MNSAPAGSPGRRLRGIDVGYTSRPVRWAEFRQRVRAHRPSELLPVIAAASAEMFDGGPMEIDPAGLHPWVLAGIARESLAYGNEHRAAPVGPGSLAALHNMYSALADPFATPGSQDSPWDLILRTVYQQADWQGASYPDMARIGAMFDRDFPSHYEVLTRDSVIDLLGGTPGEYFGASIVFTTWAQRHAGELDLALLRQPQFAELLAVLPEDLLLTVFHRVFGAPRDLVAQRCREGRNPEPELRKYDLNPLVATPFVGTGGSAYLAPVTRLVADRASVAAIYHLGQAKWQAAFTRDLGRLAEDYAGEQLGLVPGGALTPERPYAANGQSKTVDWILVLPQVVLLVEVKSARVAQPGRTDLAGFLDDVQRDIGKAFTQIARTAALIALDHPVLSDIPRDRPVRGLVVTAEPHHLINGPQYRSGLADPTVPTAVLSLEELENTVTLGLSLDPGDVMAQMTDWDPDAGAEVSRTLRRLYDQAGLTDWHNPLLSAAYARYPFKPDDQTD